LVSSLDTATGKGKNLGGTVDINAEGEYRARYDRLKKIKQDMPKENWSWLKNQDPERATYRRHPLPRPSDVTVAPGHQPTRAELIKRGFAADIKGNPLPGNERGLATLLDDVGLLDEKAMARAKAKPYRGLLKGSAGRSMRTGLKAASLVGAKPGLNMARRIGGALKGVGTGALLVLPEMALNYALPEANQKGRELASGLLGKHANTDNWFGGSEEHSVGSAGWRRNNLENIGRFAGSMLVDPLYTYAGAFKTKLKNQAARPTSRLGAANRIRTKGATGGRPIKGLISGS
jgi:hypothetical protein